MDEFGVYSIHELRDGGMTEDEIKELAVSERLTRLGRGWYAQGPLANSDAIRAVRLGGRLGCLSGCKAHGLWVPPDPSLHVLLNPGTRRPGTKPGVEFHRASVSCPTAVTPLEECLSQVLQRHDPETALIVMESALNLKLLSEADIRSLIAAAPARQQRRLQHFMPGAQSGSETRIRLWFQRHNVPVKPQAHIPGVGHVDLLVGNSWIIEADSHAHHSSSSAQEVDGERVLTARELGYDTDRLTYGHIWNTWDRTMRFLTGRVATRKHLQPPVPR
ncbi:type IV toxin-antitoxin system AbiEi family antitoxin domain-containing protein [Tessaracoccus lubricantis]|uniref:Type IV toxin-antitoxin system AbiEi family antitoxin domain-containing protein n=1 Tax=Tessaracoccus lubricantis TaxID=545543 RepID=A0ABP9FJF6_9ACTN